MRYAEIENGKVRFVLPESLSAAYLTMPPNAVEIASDAEVSEGDVYEGGVFRTATEGELNAEVLAAFRMERDARFEGTRWARERHSDRVDLGEDDEANWDLWLEYWQALRNMPDQEGFNPAAPVWPEKPE